MEDENINSNGTENDEAVMQMVMETEMQTDMEAEMQMDIETVRSTKETSCDACTQTERYLPID